MSGMEFMAEAMELAESTGMGELLEQRDVLQGQLEAAQEAGNTEKANFFRGELAKLEEQLAQQDETASGMGKGQAISFGSSREGRFGGHTESHWQKEAAKAKIEGHAYSRHLYKEFADKAKADSMSRHSK